MEHAVLITLEVGAATESVTVSADVSLLKTESSDVSHNVTGDRLTSLPILPIGNGYSSSHGVRNPMAMANLAPGTYFDPNLNIRVNGAPSNTESVRLDGQDATNGVVTFSQAQTQPSVEALQELSIQTSNYAAEYGQAGAGLINYTTKSGTNQYHGSGYDYIANEFFNASQAYSHLTPKLRRQNGGGTLGGPVYIPKIYNGHDKTFFFFNYEFFKETGLLSSQFPTVPTDAYRSGDFSSLLAPPLARALTGTGGVTQDVAGQPFLNGQIFDPSSQFIGSDGRRVWSPFSGNQIPQPRFDPSAVKVLNLIPHASLSGLLSNYNNPYLTDRWTSIPAVKIDHSFSSKMKLSFYWSATATAVQYCTPLCGSDGLPNPITATRGTFIESHTERLNFDYTLTPTMLLHIGAGYQHNDFKDTAPTTNFDLAGQLGIKGATVGPNQGARFPVFQGMLGVNSTGGMNTMGPAAGQTRSIEIKPTFNASVTWVKDNHTFKFGGDGRTEGYPQISPFNTTGNFTIGADQTANPWLSDAGITLSGGAQGFPFASFLLGRVSSYIIAQPTDTRGGRKFLAFFAQDTWKMSRKLTLDYGLRWDYFGYSREQYGRTPDFSAAVANANAGGHLGAVIFEGNGPGRCNCDFAHNYPYALGPRLGVAYQIDAKTVLRAGLGVTYSSSSGGAQGAAGASQTVNVPGAGIPAMVLSQGINVTPVWPDIRPNLFPLPGQTPAVSIVDNNSGRPARQVQWSVGLQREILHDLVVEAAYVGNRGAWWRTSSLTDYNLLSPAILAANGLNVANAADRNILKAQISQPAAGRFLNQLPYAGFPATATVAQSLRPFPQFGSITGPGPLGRTWYDSLQVKATKRLSRGLDLTYTFTWAKELMLGADSDTGGGVINDILNRDTNKQLSSFSRPFWHVLAVNYTLPKWGPNRWVKSAVSDWTIGSVVQYGSGQPIQVPNTAASDLNTALLRAGTLHAQRVAGQPLFLADLNCHCYDPSKTQVLNPAAWTDPAAGTFTTSAMYYGDYRYERRPKETMSFGRLFRIRERVSLQIRAEFQNIFNRTQVPNPQMGVPGFGAPPISYATPLSKTPTGTYNGGFGSIFTTPGNAVIGERSGLLVARFSF
ncbi:MAG: hypothetical protein LAP40_08810 [Acidobacteriia bacterium]|nr:hypothetical protein [Terriglobia bacterium]